MTDAETITGMRVDIGTMAAQMASLTDTMKEYIKRAEACQGDHETRLRAVETAAIAVAQIGDLASRLDAVEKELDTAAGRNRTINWMVNGAIGALGSIVTLVSLFGTGRL